MKESRPDAGETNDGNRYWAGKAPSSGNTGYRVNSGSHKAVIFKTCTLIAASDLLANGFAKEKRVNIVGRFDLKSAL
jgi:hypothetical protein